MAERAYYQMRTDALMVDVSLEMAMINYLISIYYVVDDRYSPTFLGVPLERENDIKRRVITHVLTTMFRCYGLEVLEVFRELCSDNFLVPCESFVVEYLFKNCFGCFGARSRVE